MTEDGDETCGTYVGIYTGNSYKACPPLNCSYVAEGMAEGVAEGVTEGVEKSMTISGLFRGTLISHFSTLTKGMWRRGSHRSVLEMVMCHLYVTRWSGGVGTRRVLKICISYSKAVPMASNLVKLCHRVVAGLFVG